MYDSQFVTSKRIKDAWMLDKYESSVLFPGISQKLSLTLPKFVWMLADWMVGVVVGVSSD